MTAIAVGSYRHAVTFPGYIRPSEVAEFNYFQFARSIGLK